MYVLVLYCSLYANASVLAEDEVATSDCDGEYRLLRSADFSTGAGRLSCLAVEKAARRDGVA